MMRVPRGTLLIPVLVAVTVACGSTVSPGALPQTSASDTTLGLNPPGPTDGTTPGQPQGPGGVSGSTGTTGSGPTATTAPTTRGGTGAPAGSHTATPTAVSGPLKLGVLDAKSPSAALAATGAGGGAGVDPAELTRVFIRYYNAHGGMAGRKLTPIEYTIDPTSSSYESDLSAACERFTHDNHLRLVVSQTGNIFSSNYESCLTKAGVTNLELSNGAPDERSLTAFPRLFTIGAPTVDRRVMAQLRGLKATGLLTASTKIGVIVEECPENQRAYTQTVVPLARSLGLTVERRGVDCVAGFSDAGKYFTQIGSAVLPYKSANVSRILFMTSFEVAALQAFENQAQAQLYSPSYVLSSIASTAVQASQYPAGAQQRMYGVGWVPVLDASGIPQTNGAKHCRDIASSGGLAIDGQGDYAFLLQICDLFAVLNAALVASHGNEEATAFSAGLDAAMPSYSSVNLLGGRSRLGGRGHDAPPVFGTFGYAASCKCFRYTGRPAALS